MVGRRSSVADHGRTSPWAGAAFDPNPTRTRRDLPAGNVASLSATRGRVANPVQGRFEDVYLPTGGAYRQQHRTFISRVRLAERAAGYSDYFWPLEKQRRRFAGEPLARGHWPEGSEIEAHDSFTWIRPSDAARIGRRRTSRCSSMTAKLSERL